MASSSKGKIGFLHIPKAGGTSFTEAVRSRFPDIYATTHLDFQFFMDLVEQSHAVAGHIPYWLFQLERTPRRLFTVLRDPVNRVVSNYRYIHHATGHYAHQYITKTKLDLIGCMEHPLIGVEMRNFQTRMLGFVPEEPPALPCRTVRDSARFAQAAAQFQFGEIGRPEVERALALLRERIDFAVLEKPDSVADLLSRISGANEVSLPHLNSSTFEYEASAAELQAVRDHNRLDLALYEAAVSMMASPAKVDQAA